MLMLIINAFRAERRCNLISIHLMLMLIKATSLVIRFISTYFNTSHVNVNPAEVQKSPKRSMYFNTSHVNVNPPRRLAAGNIEMHFNTSHVNVNHHLGRSFCVINIISIHLMLMLI